MTKLSDLESGETSKYPSVQYIIFCTRFVEEHGHASIIGLLDAVDVQGTVKRGTSTSGKIFPLTLVIGIVAPIGEYNARLEIFRPSGGMATSLDLEKFELFDGEHLYRCVAELQMEAPENGVYTFELILNDKRIDKAILPITFTISYTD